jgi:predicted secreted Zn-dependent protease
MAKDDEILNIFRQHVGLNREFRILKAHCRNGKKKFEKIKSIFDCEVLYSKVENRNSHLVNHVDKNEKNFCEIIHVKNYDLYCILNFHYVEIRKMKKTIQCTLYLAYFENNVKNLLSFLKNRVMISLTKQWMELE